MIHGHKPNAYFVAGRSNGHTVEGETRMCVHCQFVWTYCPGSGTRRGFCLKCSGLLCMRPECAAQQKELLAAFPQRTDLTCIPFEDWNNRMREEFEKDSRYRVLPSGIVIAEDFRA